MNATITPRRRILKQAKLPLARTKKDNELTSEAKENQADILVTPEAKVSTVKGGIKKTPAAPPTSTKSRTVLGELSASEVQARSALYGQPDNRRDEEEPDNDDEEPRSRGERRRGAAIAASQRVNPTRRPVNDEVNSDNGENIAPISARKGILRQQSPRRAVSAVSLITMRAKTIQRRTGLLEAQRTESTQRVTASS